MTHLVTFIITEVGLLKYALLFGVIFFSAFLIPLPANALLVAIGASIDRGYFNFTAVLFVSLIANVLGDLLGFYLSRTYGRKLFRRFKLDQSKHVKRLEHYVKYYSHSIIFFTRFITSFGTVVNYLAGLSKVDWKTFFIYDVAGNLSDILLLVAIGYFADSYYERFSAVLNTTGIYFIVAIIVVVAVVIFRKAVPYSDED